MKVTLVFIGVLFAIIAFVVAEPEPEASAILGNQRGFGGKVLGGSFNRNGNQCRCRRIRCPTKPRNCKPCKSTCKPPTTCPGVTATQAPSVAPTSAPTAASTAAPTAASTAAPTVTPIAGTATTLAG